LRERGGVALEMLRQLAHVTDVLFLGRLAEIFQLDQLLELGDRRIVNMFHSGGSMCLSGHNSPHKNSKTFRRTRTENQIFQLLLPRSGSVQPERAANGRQPFRSACIRASPAAASRG